MEYNIDGLSENEKQELLSLLTKIGAYGEEPVEEHCDVEEDIEMLEPIKKVIQQMLDKIAAMDDEIDALSKLVNEEIIGGVTKLYNEKSRMEGISGLSSKYADKFGPYSDFYKELSGKDIFDALYDEIDERKKATPDWDDEHELSTIEELTGELKNRLEKFKSIPGVVSVEATVNKMEKPEEEKAPELNPEDEKKKAYLEKLRRMKNDSRQTY